MKKVSIVLLALTCAAGLAFAEDFSKDGMLLKPGTIDVNAGIGYGWYYGLDVGVGGEYVIGKFDIAKGIPLTFGAAARAGLYLGYFGSTPLAIGAFGTLHFNWAAITWPDSLAWLKNVDTYIGIGLDFVPRLGFDTIGGSSYFFSKNLAANVETGINGSQFGILLKL